MPLSILCPTLDPASSILSCASCTVYFVSSTAPFTAPFVSSYALRPLPSRLSAQLWTLPRLDRPCAPPWIHPPRHYRANCQSKILLSQRILFGQQYCQRS